MIEFELPPADPSGPPERPLPWDFSTLLGSPSSRGIGSNGFGPFPPPAAAASDAAMPSSRPDDAASAEDTPLPFQRSPQTPPKPSWQQAAETIEAVYAQRVAGFSIAQQPRPTPGGSRYAAGAPADDPNIVRVTDVDPVARDNETQFAQQQDAQQLPPIPARGIAPDVEPPSNSPELEKAFQDWDGRLVRLPDGSPIPDPYSPNGYLMSPFSDLRDMAKAGKEAGLRYRALLRFGPAVAFAYLYQALGNALGHGGTFDYQRRRYELGNDGFTQLRQFRSVSNFNVGLFCQQAGLALWETLLISGVFAFKNSRNVGSLRSYFLDPQTKYFIELGYLTGQSGAYR